MKAVRIASISLAALFALTPYAHANQATTTISYVPKPQPVTFPQQAVSADVLGIRIGMTVAQAEAVAQKSYKAKPEMGKAPDTFSYKGVSVQSHPYVQSLQYVKSTAHGGQDTLQLYFSGPATGNRLYAMTRQILFNTNVFDPKSALIDPQIKTLKASLIKKYGPPSYDGPGYNGSIWAFTPKARLSWSKYWPTSESYTQVAGARGGELSSYATGTSANMICGAFDPKHSNVFLINAEFALNRTDRTKADNLKIAIWDPPACMNDVSESVKQMKAAALKAYKSVSAPAAPKL